MKRSLLISILCGFLFVPTAFAGTAPSPIVLYSQDHKTEHALNLIYGTQTAEDYFDLQSGSAHPTFGTADGTASLAIYWDTTDHSMSLISVVGTPGGQNGAVVESILGVPPGGAVSLAQNPSEVSTHHKGAKVTTDFNFGQNTDGTVLGSLENAKFHLTVDFAHESGLTELRLANGDPSVDGTFDSLDLNEPVFFDRVWLGRHQHVHAGAVGGGVGVPIDGGSGSDGGDITGASIPEPTSLGLIGAVGMMLTARPRRR